MLFNSIDFGIFFTLVFVAYWTFFNKERNRQNIFLTIVSYIFYGWWDWRFLSLIIISSLVDFWVGGQLGKTEDDAKRKRFVWLSVLVNIGFLGFFKYFNFFIDSFQEAFTLFGGSFLDARLDIILPVGISFYTFQTLSYTFDIYQKKMEPTKDLPAFLAFVSFFPQLVAGPIERAKHLLPQFHEHKSITYDQLRSGFILMAWGFFKKIVIADRLARYVDASFGDITLIGGFAAFLGAFFFALQLYFDFSAYSDIAIGSARTLGFDLRINFRRPYLSSTFSDFWTRWHISLSSWFRDYLYIPLGGSRTGKTIRNILIVFLVSGLWHGASWNFVIWGGINGLFLILFDRFLKEKAKGLVLFAQSLFVTISWTISLIFFRAETFTDAITYFIQLFSTSSKTIYELGLESFEFNVTISLLVGMFVFEWFEEKQETFYPWFKKQHLTVRWVTYLLLIFTILFFGSYGVGVNDSNFIYFQF